MEMLSRLNELIAKVRAAIMRPYSSLEDANPAIKGIDPPVTLAQANKIAEWADAMEESDDPPDSPWAAAIAQFKKLYEVKGDGWVEKEKDEERAIGMSQIFGTVDGALCDMESWPWLHDVYVDEDGSLFGIVSSEGKLFRFAISHDGEGNVELGEFEPVVEEFRPATRTRTTVLRTAEGQYRWLSVSATSVLNKVGEIDSRALFDSFIASANEMGEFPYRTFFHCGEALRTGQADFLARDGYCLVTSGLYDLEGENADLARAEIEAFEREPEAWGESINYEPTAEPVLVEVAEGVRVPVYTAGVLREISTVPADKACNLFTAPTRMEVTRMLEQVRKALIPLFGGDEDAAEAFVSKVDGTNRAIDEGGLVARAQREAEPEPTEPEPTEPSPEGEEPTEEPAPEGEVEEPGEVVLDEEALDAIAERVAVKFRPLGEAVAALGEAVATLSEAHRASVEDAEAARGLFDERLKALEADDDEKRQRYLEDLPRRITNATHVTVRPREARAPGDGGGEEEDTGEKVQQLLDEKVQDYPARTQSKKK